MLDIKQSEIPGLGHSVPELNRSKDIKVYCICGHRIDSHSVNKGCIERVESSIAEDHWICGCRCVVCIHLSQTDSTRMILCDAEMPEDMQPNQVEVERHILRVRKIDDGGGKVATTVVTEEEVVAIATSEEALTD